MHSCVVINNISIAQSLQHSKESLLLIAFIVIRRYAPANPASVLFIGRPILPTLV